MDRRVVFLLLAIIAVVVAVATRWPSGEDETSPLTELEAPPVTSQPDLSNEPPPSRIPRDVFPDLDANSDSEPGIDYLDLEFECALLDDAFDEDISKIDDRVEEMRSYGLQVFSSAGGAEYLWAGAILSWNEDPDETRAFLERALNEHPDFYPTTALALRECADSGLFCEYFTEDRLLGQAEVNDDVATWIHLADHYANTGDDDRALEAVRRAASAPKFSDQTLPNIRAAQRGLAAFSDLDAWETALGGLGLGIETAEPIFVSACTTRIQDSEEWMQACIGMGERLAFDTSAGLNRMGGLALVGRLYNLSGREDEANELSAELHRIAGGIESIESLANRVALARDDQLLNDYLERWNDSDDPLGIDYLRSEIERKIEAGEYPALSECTE